MRRRRAAARRPPNTAIRSADRARASPRGLARSMLAATPPTPMRLARRLDWASTRAIGPVCPRLEIPTLVRTPPTPVAPTTTYHATQRTRHNSTTAPKAASFVLSVQPCLVALNVLDAAAGPASDQSRPSDDDTVTRVISWRGAWREVGWSHAAIAMPGHASHAGRLAERDVSKAEARSFSVSRPGWEI